MVRFTGGLLLFTALSLAAPADTDKSSYKTQQVLKPALQPKNPRHLRGRFLHITDLHPDPFYRIGTESDGDHPCHQGEGGNATGYYGAAVSECDSPFTLVNATFKWIDEHIKDEIDFVIWTGDSARHDNDEDIPRSNEMVENLNIYVVSKFREVFGKKDNIGDGDPTNDFVVPIVPTFGNNDMLPHNILEPGPNRWTRRYLDIWREFIPEEQSHSFARGGWFFSEVIPNRLAIISLNSMYFFGNNAAVDGCAANTEPGYEHMEWLRIQLQFLRQRKMKVILTGHVPPARTEGKQSWDESCWQKYALWQHQYRDVIVANMFGHMNMDHFMFEDVQDIIYKFDLEAIHDNASQDLVRSRRHTYPDEMFNITGKAEYINDLRDKWSTLPSPPQGLSYIPSADEWECKVLDGAGSDLDVSKKGKKEKKGKTHKKKEDKGRKAQKKFLKEIGGKWAERFTMSFAAPSVVPNFFPTLRIIEYNITGLEHDHPATAPVGRLAEESDLDLSLNGPQIEEESKLRQDGSDVQDDISISFENCIDGGDDNDDDDDDNHDTNDNNDLVSVLKKKKHKKKHKKKKHNKGEKPDFRVPKPPSKSSPPGPAHSPQTLSVLGFTQYYANLTEIYEEIAQSRLSKWQPQLTSQDDLSTETDKTRLEKENYKHFKYQVEYDTRNDSIYRLHDFTVRSWLDLAYRIGKAQLKRNDVEETDEKDEVDVQGRLKDNYLWSTFVRRVFVNAKSEEDLDDDYD